MKQPEFDLDYFVKNLPPEKLLGDEKFTRGRTITSPVELVKIEELRKLVAAKIDLGKRVPTDVFVWNYGEAKDRYATKIGGLPCWPKAWDWPTDEDGKKCVFLGQFCFHDSRDLLPPLPGDILAVFISESSFYEFCESDLQWFWIKKSRKQLVQRVPKSRVVFPTCFGHRYRTFDYTQFWTNYSRSRKRLPKNLAASVGVLDGTKIGGVPYHLHKMKEQYKSRSRYPGRFLCSLGSVQVTPNCPYPWINRRKEITLDEMSERHLELCIIDMGSIYFFYDKKGTVRCVVESY